MQGTIHMVQLFAAMRVWTTSEAMQAELNHKSVCPFWLSCFCSLDKFPFKFCQVI